MMINKAAARIDLKNIIFLTDFSEAAHAAAPVVTALAHAYSAEVHVLHVQTPIPLMGVTPEAVLATIEAQEETSRQGMKHVETLLNGTPHESQIVRGSSVWPALKDAIAECGADLVVVGTHGRMGAEKLFLGSVAEDIFRQASIPVLTVGPEVRTRAGWNEPFRHILFATDLTLESMAGLPYAVSLAEENQARLTLLHVLPKVKDRGPRQTTVATAMHALCELVPQDADDWCRPHAAVEFGQPPECILQAAIERNCDLIVLGVRNTAVPTVANHLRGGIAYQVVARAPCPVLTVRGTKTDLQSLE